MKPFYSWLLVLQIFSGEVREMVSAYLTPRGFIRRIASPALPDLRPLEADLMQL
jgi:hypothetical protein